MVAGISEILRSRFNDITVSRGKKHTFLGMDIQIRDDGMVALKMQEYLVESIDTFGEEVTHKSPIPTSSKLFSVCKSKFLDDKKKDICHHIVDKLLYVSKGVRIDLAPTIDFLCTRVSKSIEDD